jgi:hypothetical protein
MPSRAGLGLCLALLALATGSSARAQVPELLPIPAGLTGPQQDALANERGALQSRLAALQSNGREFNAACNSVKAGSSADADCQRRYRDLDGARRDYQRGVIDFNKRLRAAIAAEQTMPASAAELVAALNEISNLPIFLNQRTGTANSPLPKGRPVDQKLVDNNCQTFFRALGKELARRGMQSWSDAFPLDHVGEPMADGIVAEIDKKANDGRDWKKLVSWQDAQRLANEGAIVIGGLRADPPHGRNHGHLAIVFPTPPGMDWAKFEAAGQGPFVRDGNEHLYQPRDRETGEKTGEERLHPSTWGAIRASRAMPLSQTSWYLWTPSK